MEKEVFERLVNNKNGEGSLIWKELNNGYRFNEKTTYWYKKTRKQNTSCTIHICDYCGVLFIGRVKQKKLTKGRYCSKSCTAKSHYPPPKDYVCKYCKKTYQIRKLKVWNPAAKKFLFRKRQGGKTYCSRECAFKSHKNWNSSTIKAYSKIHWPNRCSNVYFINCHYCQSLFTTRSAFTKYCSDNCRYQMSLNLSKEKYRFQHQIPLTKSCLNCGEQFNMNDGRSKYCSPQCAKRHWKCKQVKNLTNSYIKKLLCWSGSSTLKSKDIPKELIDLKHIQIEHRRELSNHLPT